MTRRFNGNWVPSGCPVPCAAMTRFRPHRWLPLLRVFVLGLFALGLVLQPVTAAVGEMHELAHDPPDTHSHDLHADGLDARSEEHTSELQSLMRTSYAVFCLKKNTTNKI